ncbi:MAG: DNA-3-methyladenine glycosylase family protein [Verrucomicrobiota bacterium]
MNATTQRFPVKDYDLAATLASGQAFRWRLVDGAWEGVVTQTWVRLSIERGSIVAETAKEVVSWVWLEEYLQTQVDLSRVVASFPNDVPMCESVAACHGLRLLKQEPWECLASFILSSTKQIVHIQQNVQLLCVRYGERVATPKGRAPVYAFPRPERLAQCTEAELRESKMGFRAKYLLAAAQAVASGRLDLESLRAMSCAEARERLMELPGVGRKIADCVLLFAYGFQEAFPVDVWVLKALQQLYFPKRRASAKRLAKFTATYFGPNSGYAQQYLFHYMRTQLGRKGKKAK